MRWNPTTTAILAAVAVIGASGCGHSSTPSGTQRKIIGQQLREQLQLKVTRAEVRRRFGSPQYTEDKERTWHYQRVHPVDGAGEPVPVRVIDGDGFSHNELIIGFPFDNDGETQTVDSVGWADAL